ncbi:phosphate/phosphite/phosphonate ABC transporter substrate-binding protein [Marinobacterium maritimum]|uniref:Phosphate/phosphite/phosphonate ABC transporter substrate-binding protein n=1 Tax=Marinobacterium maritimum TaxID=500162 RepID=A0ABP3TG91_9GAMM
MLNHHRLLAVILLFFLVFPTAGLQAADGRPVLRVGIVPQQSAARLAELWTPILAYLSRQSGYQLDFETAPDIPAFERRLAEGQYDLAYMNPYHYTVFHQQPGYAAIARQKGARIHGLLVVRRDSPIMSLQELQGHTLAFPSPAAFAASILPRGELKQLGIQFTPRYVSSHDSVYLGVAQGLFPAGGGIDRTLSNLPESLRGQLRILWRTHGFTPHAFAVHPRLSAATKARLQQALIDMDITESGRSLLSTIRFSGIEAATDSDWDDVRALDIQLLLPLIE